MRFPLQLATLVLSLALSEAAFGQGPLTPPGAPAPLFKTLAQVEPRTPISSLPITISVPGSYYLTTNLTVASGNAIAIVTNGVALDLNGFTISSTAPSGNFGTAILFNSGLSDLSVCNGFIRSGFTNNGANVYTGIGFAYGIHAGGASGTLNTRVVGVTVAGCQRIGIDLGLDSTLIESCLVRTIGGNGISASTVKNSMAIDCHGIGITADQVSDSRGECTVSDQGVLANRSAQNCYGFSKTGTGLYANTALNCYGYSVGSTGLYAISAQNCNGYSGSGIGLTGQTAANCFGTSTSGSGMVVQTAQNCYGSSSTGTGLSATIAMACVGNSTSGRDLQATIANSCSGTSNIISYK